MYTRKDLQRFIEYLNLKIDVKYTFHKCDVSSTNLITTLSEVARHRFKFGKPQMFVGKISQSLLLSIANLHDKLLSLISIISLILPNSDLS